MIPFVLLLACLGASSRAGTINVTANCAFTDQNTGDVLFSRTTSVGATVPRGTTIQIPTCNSPYGSISFPELRAFGDPMLDFGVYGSLLGDISDWEAYDVEFSLDLNLRSTQTYLITGATGPSTTSGEIWFSFEENNIDLSAKLLSPFGDPLPSRGTLSFIYGQPFTLTSELHLNVSRFFEGPGVSGDYQYGYGFAPEFTDANGDPVAATIVVVPEPGTSATAAGLLGALVIFQRVRRAR